MKIVRTAFVPTATIYQNVGGIIAIFTNKDGSFNGGRISFENVWHDGGACGLSGFKNRKELNEFLKENNYKKRGKVDLSLYCWSKHVVKTYKKRISKNIVKDLVHGGTATCMLKLDHKGKHKGTVSSGFNSDDIEVEW